jgi:uncharacterized protein (TIGR02646 family)
MRFIQKGTPPEVAVELRARKARWGEEGKGEKAILREAAIDEQRGLCAYCNGRLKRDHTTTLEHWRPRSDDKTEHFDWLNLLAVCPGGTSRDLHCDKSRGDKPLILNPASRSPSTEQLVEYYDDGHVGSEDSDVEAELESTLNLNAALLVRWRRATVDAITQELAAAESQGSQAAKLRATKALLARYEAKAGDLPPYPLLVLPKIRAVARRVKARGARLKQSR